MSSERCQRASPTQRPSRPTRSRGPYRRPLRKASASPMIPETIMSAMAGTSSTVPL